MSLQCLPPTMGSSWLTVQEQTWFEDFQAGHSGSHLGHWNKMILAILNLYVAPMPPIKFKLNSTWTAEQNYLAILNLYVTSMPPIKFRLNPTYGLGDVVWRISRWLPWWPSWISERNYLSNSESLCHFDASHKVSAKSDMVWEEMSFEEFQDGRPGGHLRYQNQTILAILNHCPTVKPPIKFQLNPTYGLGGDIVWRISKWPCWISEGNNFSNSESPCCHSAFH